MFCDSLSPLSPQWMGRNFFCANRLFGPPVHFGDEKWFPLLQTNLLLFTNINGKVLAHGHSFSFEMRFPSTRVSFSLNFFFSALSNIRTKSFSKIWARMDTTGTTQRPISIISFILPWVMGSSVSHSRFIKYKFYSNLLKWK